MKYRLKKEAVKFFKEKHATSIYDFDTWMSLNVDENALEKVEDCFISYGHVRGNGGSLSGWDEKGSEFHFTLHFPSSKHMEHDKFSNGRIVREMMQRIQSEMNNYFEEFINQEAQAS